MKQPDHYTRFSIQPAEFIMINELPWDVGNIVKYAVRAGYKIYPGLTARQSAVIDLRKAGQMVQMMLDMIEIGAEMPDEE